MLNKILFRPPGTRIMADIGQAQYAAATGREAVTRTIPRIELVIRSGSFC